MGVNLSKTLQIINFLLECWHQMLAMVFILVVVAVVWYYGS